MHEILLWPVLFFLGALAGTYSSLVGGGALLLIPLFTWLGAPLVTAIATLRLSAVFSQLMCVVAFTKERKVEWRLALWASLWVLPGAWLGARLTLAIDQRLLAYLVAGCMLLLLGLILLLDKKRLARKRRRRPGHWQVLAVLSAGLGIYGGFYGAGFSTVLMMLFILLSGSPLLQASANASLVTLCMSLVASAFFLRNGLVDWQLFLPVTLGGVLGSWLGVEWFSHKSMVWIKLLLAGVVLASVAKLLLAAA